MLDHWSWRNSEISIGMIGITVISCPSSTKFLFVGSRTFSLGYYISCSKRQLKERYITIILRDSVVSRIVP